MSSTSNASYEEWKGELPSMPPRSTLYPLKPIGVGTSLVESLTSYITRLAEAHCLFPGILMGKVIAPLVQHNPVYKECWWEMHIGHGRQSYMFNAMHRPAACVVQTLETLTQQHSLRFLTLLTWAETFPTHRFIRQMRAWCPLCLEEQWTTGQVIYEPLLWTIQSVTLCARHQCRLQTRCSHAGCGRELPWLAWSGLPGYCPYCHCWLGTLHPASAETDGVDLCWEHWVTEQLEMLLALAPTVAAPPSHTRIQDVLMHFSRQFHQGSLKACARLLGFPWGTFAGWICDQQFPLLENLLLLCSALGVSLQACLFDEVTTLSFRPSGEMLKPLANKTQPAARHSWESLQTRQRLEAILKNDEEPPPSLREVARRFGAPPGSLRDSHPDLCRAISARYLTFRQERGRVIMQQRCEEVRQAAYQLAEQGKRPTGKNLGKVLAKPGVLRSPHIRKAWKAMLREMESG